MPFAANPLAATNPLTGGFRSFRLVQSSQAGRTLARWLVGLSLLGLGACFLPWTQNIRSTGTLTALRPQDRPQTVPSTIAGRIARWHVREGQAVRRGDTLVTLTEIKEKYFDPELVARTREQLQAKIAALGENQAKGAALGGQQTALRAGLRVGLGKARNKVTQASFKVGADEAELRAAHLDYDIARQQLGRQESLYQQGLKSLTELEQRRLRFQESTAMQQVMTNKLGASRQDLANSRLELASLTADYQDKLAKSESDRRSATAYQFDGEGQLAKLRNELATLRIRAGYYQITAPQDGYVVRALKQGLGEMVQEGEPVATVMPRNPVLAAELYVRPMDVPLLRVGRRVRLQFDGWPALVFSGWPGTSAGTFGGVVAVIDNIDSQGQYRILVVPDPAHESWPVLLRVGSGVYGWVLLNDVPIWYELWRQVNGFPPNFVGSPAAAKGGKAGKTPIADAYQEPAL